MSERKWLDASQPQTLQAAVMLSYINAVLALLFFFIGGGAPAVLLICLGVAAFFIANERRWAYWAAVGLSIVYFVAALAFLVAFGGLSSLLNVAFAGVVVALLLHPQSRAYQKIWFH
jgi:hypothetical protein